MMTRPHSENATRYLPPIQAGPDHQQQVLWDSPPQQEQGQQQQQKQQQQNLSNIGLLPIVRPHSSGKPDNAPTEPPVAVITSDIVHGSGSPSPVLTAERPRWQQQHVEHKPPQRPRVDLSPSQPWRAANTTTVGGGRGAAISTSASASASASASGSASASASVSASASPALTPGRAKVEVVLQMSPAKRPPGYERFDHLDEDQDDELLGPSTLDPPQKRPLGKRPKNYLRPSHSVSSGPVLQLPPTASDSGDALIPVKRPRGRPKGWRPGMPSLKSLKLGSTTAAAAASVESRRKHADKEVSRNTGLKRRGRPPRPPSPTPRGVWETMKAPQYVPFRCEWMNCKAELQNIETLRRHVHKVHGQTDPLVCHWASCRKTEAEAAEGEGKLHFERDGDFYNHVDSRHLLPFVWFVGDGARNTKCMFRPKETREREIPKYLLGPDGVQVTPWVQGQQIEDLLTYRENRRRLKEILMQRDANAPSEVEFDDSTES